MLVRDAVLQRLAAAPPIPDEEAGRASLPTHLRPDATLARTAILRRLGASRLFAHGDRAGVLRTAQARSGRPFRPDIRQRVIVKARVAPHGSRGSGLPAHLAYLGRAGAGQDGARPGFFGREADRLDPAEATAGWEGDRRHFRFIISPEHGDRIADLRRYTREVMRRVADDLGQPGLEWVAACHFDTDQPHAHVVVRGRRASGKDLVIPRDYIAYGFRARAQEAAHELLGDLSRIEAERRIWREARADRFTGFDRRLLAAADAEGLVDDGVGAGGAWAALTRGRLRHLEGLGLAVRVGARFRLDPRLERRLRRLERRQETLRALGQRRLESGRDVRELSGAAVRGRVVARGTHDALGARPWVVVRDRDGVEHYARLEMGHAPPRLGRSVDLVPTDRGARALQAGRDLGLGA